MATVAKTSITADTSNIADGQAIDAGDVVVPIEDNRDNIREGRVAAIGTATHVGTLDDVITVTAPVVKSITSPTGDARLNLDVTDMVAATGIAAGAAGLVPEPAAGDEGKFLRGDATWVAAPGTGTVTSVAAGDGLATLSGAAITATGTIVVNDPSVCGVRLSLESGVAVSSSDQSAKASLYLVPYVHDRISMWDGSRWVLDAAVGTTSYSLVGLTASTLYDVFAYDSGGLAVEFVAWTSSGAGSSSRATALTTQNGVLVKSGDATRRYLGTIYINSAGGQTDDTVLKRYVWNQYNRVPRKMRAADSSNSWVYGTATWRPLNNATSNRVEFVAGQVYEPVKLTHLNYLTGAFATIGIDLNAITDGITGTEFIYGGLDAITMCQFNSQPAVGYNYLQLMERGASGATFQGTSGTAFTQTGASGEVYA